MGPDGRRSPNRGGGSADVTAVWQRRADELDARDPLGGLRARFGLPDGLVYLDGNSLGPPAHESEAALRRVMAEWR
jgi:kynureninase